MSAGAKTKTQQLYFILEELEERNRAAKLPVFADRLLEAMELLEQIDPDANADAEYVDGRVYGR
jgi:hypothetical protein